MAGQDRAPFDHLRWFAELERDPSAFDFHVVLRRIELSLRDRPPLGTALRPSDEPIRVGQDPSTAFSPRAISAFRPSKNGKPPRLDIAFTGMFGPNGALPLHLTEYSRDRMRLAGDGTFTSFVNLLQHRLLLLFHRAWTKSQATASRDRPAADRFKTYIGALMGIALDRPSRRSPTFDEERLYYGGRLALRVRNPDAIAAIISDYLELPAAIEEFVGEWVMLPDASRWRLGQDRLVSVVGESTIVGARTWRRDHKFRIILGPLSLGDFEDLLPGAPGLARLRTVVRDCVGDELKWDIRLIRGPGANDEIRLREHGRLGWTSRLGASVESPEFRRTDLIVDPNTSRTVRVPSQPLQALPKQPTRRRARARAVMAKE
jgi:type VI secretion system protein ImpH